MPDDRTTILFLCTGNSARSILAEAICNQRFGATLRAESAGSAPKDRPHPMALETLRRHGLRTEGLRSKSWEAFGENSFDLVITLCDSARNEPCPVFPGAPGKVHWSLPDPPAAGDPEAAFELVYRVLDEAIGLLAEAPPGGARAGAEAAARRVETRLRAPRES